MPEEKIQNLENLSLTADGCGAVFDVPADDVDTFLEGIDLKTQLDFSLTSFSCWARRTLL